MDWLQALRFVAALLTVIAAIMVAAKVSPRVTVAGFILFIAASVAWLIDGWIEAKLSLVIQNAVLLLVNLVGVYRWLPRG